MSTLPPELNDELRNTSVLASYWLAVGLGLVTLAVVVMAAWAVAARTGTARRVRQGIGIGVATLLLALTVGAASNTYAGYILSFHDLGARMGLVSLEPPGGGIAAPQASGGSATASTLAGGTILRKGRVASLEIRSRSTPVAPGLTYLYLPPGYEDAESASRRYPVLYLLHGDPGSSGDWLGGETLKNQMDILISSGSVPPMILVMPDITLGRSTDYSCRNKPNGPMAADFLSKEVPAEVDRVLRSIPDPEHRIIGGMSAGGNCALELVLTRQETFGGVISFAPEGGPGNGVMDAVKRPEVAAGLKGKPAYVDVGSKDTIHHYTENVVKQLKGAGMNVTYRITPGEGHNWNQPRLALPHALVDIAAKQHWSPDPPRKA